MNIALIGSGGREHALCKKIFNLTKLQKFIVFQVTEALLKLLKILK